MTPSWKQCIYVFFRVKSHSTKWCESNFNVQIYTHAHPFFMFSRYSSYVSRYSNIWITREYKRDFLLRSLVGSLVGHTGVNRIFTHGLFSPFIYIEHIIKHISTSTAGCSKMNKRHIMDIRNTPTLGLPKLASKFVKVADLTGFGLCFWALSLQGIPKISRR